MQHHEEEEAEDVAWIYNGQPEVPATVRHVKIAETVTRIPDEAFREHEELEEVSFSSSVEVIGKLAFYECMKLKSILYRVIDGNEEKEEVGIPSNVKVIESGAFDSCTSLGRLGLNEGLERIGECAFGGCESLKEVNLPSTVTVIDHDAFQYCEHLERLGLNEGLEGIGEYTFCGCVSLTEVDFPSTVKVIDTRAFWRCKLLTRVGLNEGLERIGNEAFSGCSSLSRVRIPQTVNSIATTTFIECDSLISIELPEDCSFNIDLSGCQSLVNLVAGPMPTLYRDANFEQSFQRSKLGSLVDNEADLIHKLSHRFDLSPLHKLCYYQSYQSLDAAMAQLRSRMGENPLAATTKVDEFGMTPLHILSLSQTPNLDMFLAVMDAGKPGHMVRVMDSFGCTPMDYFCLNSMPNSNDVVRRLFQTRFGQVLGLDQFWKPDMLQAIDEALGGDWAFRKSKIGGAVRKYEQKEILSIVELYLWKMKIDEVTFEQMLLADRQRCRIMSGAAAVIPHVLRFLDSN
eukprot:scaffold865_cov87-Cylindrotheca_fusiformis.AAC.5